MADNPTSVTPTPRAAITRLCRLAVLGAIAGLLSPWAARWLPGTVGWLASLAAQWQWLLLAMLVVGAGILSVSTRSWRHLGWLLAGALPWMSVAPRLIAGQADVGPTLRVVAANLQGRPDAVKPLADWFARLEPDVVVLSEADPDVAAQLRGLPGWQVMEAPRRDAFAMVILTRKPALSRQILGPLDGLPMVQVEFELSTGLRVRLTGFHPLPPMTAQAEENIVAKIDLLTRPSATPAIIAGDFNATPWAPAMHLAHTRGWERAGHLQPTWPSAWQGRMGLPIDQVLASPGWRVVDWQVGPQTGSDHLPVYAELVWPEASSM